MLAAGANIDATDDVERRSPLLWAAICRHDGIVRVLLEKGANPNVRGNLDGRTALIWAAIQNNQQLAEMLLGHGAKVNLGDERGRTALLFAVSGSAELVETILAHGADVNAQDRKGTTALPDITTSAGTDALAFAMGKPACPGRREMIRLLQSRRRPGAQVRARNSSDYRKKI